MLLPQTPPPYRFARRYSSSFSVASSRVSCCGLRNVPEEVQNSRLRAEQAMTVGRPGALLGLSRSQRLGDFHTAGSAMLVEHVGSEDSLFQVRSGACAMNWVGWGRSRLARGRGGRGGVALPLGAQESLSSFRL